MTTRLTRCDTIAVEGIFFREFFTFAKGPLSSIFSILGSSKPSRSLLIHFGARSNPINSQKEGLFGLNLGKQMVYIVKDTNPDLFFSNTEMSAFIIVVRAVVNDPIHIQVQVICVRWGRETDEYTNKQTNERNKMV